MLIPTMPTANNITLAHSVICAVGAVMEIDIPMKNVRKKIDAMNATMMKMMPNPAGMFFPPSLKMIVVMMPDVIAMLAKAIPDQMKCAVLSMFMGLRPTSTRLNPESKPAMTRIAASHLFLVTPQSNAGKNAMIEPPMTRLALNVKLPGLFAVLPSSDSHIEKLYPGYAIAA